MATKSIGGVSASAASDELLLRETNHRCSNDLQLVVGLLALQGRRTQNMEVRQALNDAMERVAVLARSRQALQSDRPQSLNSALQNVCDALHAQAEPRRILVAYAPGDDLGGLSVASITTLALVVNELSTNAIKHAFGDGEAGHVRVSAGRTGRNVIVTVDDDGSPFAEAGTGRAGIGMNLARRMMVAVEGLFVPPLTGSKLFELRVPIRADMLQR